MAVTNAKNKMPIKDAVLVCFGETTRPLSAEEVYASLTDCGHPDIGRLAVDNVRDIINDLVAAGSVTRRDLGHVVTPAGNGLCAKLKAGIPA